MTGSDDCAGMYMLAFMPDELSLRGEVDPDRSLHKHFF